MPADLTEEELARLDVRQALALAKGGEEKR